MKTKRFLVFCGIILGLATSVVAAPPKGRGKILNVKVSNKSDSAGRRVKEMVVTTEQSGVPMWCTVTAHVLVKDADDNLFFGEKPMRSARRSGSKNRRHDTWKFHVVTDQMNNADIAGYYVTYSDNTDDRIVASKSRNVNDPEEWLKEHKTATPLTVLAESHSVGR